jgi:hypothetical protein
MLLKQVERREIPSAAVTEILSRELLETVPYRGLPFVCSGQDRLNDFGISGAAAQIAAEILLDLLLCRPWVLVKQGLSSHNHSRSTIPALHRKMLNERLLKRMQFTFLIIADPLNGHDLPASRFHCGKKAALHRFAVNEHGARTAIPGFTAYLGPG